MQRLTRGTWVRRALVAAVLGAAVGMSTAPALAQDHELPTGAARVVKKVELMALTGKSEIDYTIGRILENNAGLIPRP